MTTLKSLVQEYNELAKLYDDVEPVKTFKTKLIAADKLRELRRRVTVKRNDDEPTQKDLMPTRGGTFIQDTVHMTRREAMLASVVLYWTGKPCDREHMSARYTKSGHCKKCYQDFRAEEIEQKDISKDPLPRKGSDNAN